MILDVWFVGWGIALGICCGVVVFGVWCFVRFVSLLVTVCGFDFGVVLWVGVFVLRFSLLEIGVVGCFGIWCFRGACVGCL